MSTSMNIFLQENKNLRKGKSKKVRDVLDFVIEKKREGNEKK